MKVRDTTEAEVAVLVSDRWQGRGLGKELLARLLLAGACRKFSRLTAYILPDNRDVLSMCAKLGFSLLPGFPGSPRRVQFVNSVAQTLRAAIRLGQLSLLTPFSFK